MVRGQSAIPAPSADIGRIQVNELRHPVCPIPIMPRPGQKFQRILARQVNFAAPFRQLPHPRRQGFPVEPGAQIPLAPLLVAADGAGPGDDARTVATVHIERRKAHLQRAVPLGVFRHRPLMAPFVNGQRRRHNAVGEFLRLMQRRLPKGIDAHIGVVKV